MGKNWWVEEYLFLGSHGMGDRSQIFAYRSGLKEKP